MKDYICKCLSCEEFFVDKNPSPMQEKVEVTKEFKELVYNQETQTWDCPKCKHDCALNSIENY